MKAPREADTLERHRPPVFHLLAAVLGRADRPRRAAVFRRLNREVAAGDRRYDPFGTEPTTVPQTLDLG